MYIHIVEKGETLGEIASRYSIEKSLLAKDNGIKEDSPLPEGCALVIGVSGNKIYNVEIFSSIAGNVDTPCQKEVFDYSTYIIYLGNSVTDGKVVFTGHECKSFTKDLPGVEKCLGVGFSKSDETKANIQAAIDKVVSIDFPWLAIAYGVHGGPKGFVKDVARACHDKGKRLMVSISPDGYTDEDWQDVSFADRIIIAHSPEVSCWKGIGPGYVTKTMLENALRFIPPKKLLLGLNPKPVVIRKINGAFYRIAYSDAMILAESVNASITYNDDEGMAYFCYTNYAGEEECCVFYDPRSFVHLFKLVNRYGIAGVGVTDARCGFSPFWSVVKNTCNVL